MTYTISEIAKIINAQSTIHQDCEIKYLLIDSRNVVTTKNTLFFAISGKRHNGHEYIEELYEKGIRNFIVEKISEKNKKYKDVNFLFVKSVLNALQQLVSAHRSKFAYPVLGITGSNGKTIVKEWIYHVLQGERQIIRNPKSYNSQVGVPLSVWLMEKSFDLAVFEAGISQPGEMEHLQKIIQPTIGLITNIGEPHQKNFNNKEQKTSEKLKLFKNTDFLIYCKDHEIIEKELNQNSAFSDKKTFTWSFNTDADLKIISVDKSESKSIISFEFSEKTDNIIIPFTDNASIEDAIHTLAFVYALKVDVEVIKQKFESLPTVAMRMELKKGINNCTLINDTYNSDINSLSIALNYLDQQNQHKIKTLILSDILQSGKNDEVLYKEVAALLDKFKVDRLIGIGEAISRQSQLFKIKSQFYKTTEEFLKEISIHRFSDEAILIKGSRSFYFEDISKALEEKAHRTVLEINLNSMVHNLNYFKSLLNSKTKIMVMVKALSYGSGTHEIANILQYQRVDYLGVAFADEGVSLRQAGIKTPIIVMNPEQNSFDLMLEHRLEPEIYNLKILRQFISIVEKSGLKNYPVHIKIDTGMHRLGFVEDDINTLLKDLEETNALKVSTIFSHLAASDEEVHDDFTTQQISVFKKYSDKIMDGLGYKATRHILNSAGIERFPDTQFEMVRLGIGLYGISAVHQEHLETVSTLKSTVIQVKQISKNETIGYSRKGIAKKDMTIAVIPIGYADGLNRKLSNGKGKLYVNGCYVPIVGNICMDMCMVDITGCNIHEGDEIIVFGKERSVIELANTLETIPYEIFTSVSTRVKRVYYQE